LVEGSEVKHFGAFAPAGRTRGEAEMTHLSEGQAPIHKREFWRIVGAFSIGLFFYYAILLIIYYVHEIHLFNQDYPQALIREKSSLMVALREYRKEHKAYPILPDNPIGDVKQQLISGGYLLPSSDADKDARYVSPDGQSYGLKFHSPRGRSCIVEVDATKTGWWSGDLPKCRF
jgi:hypothetical protein